MILFMTTFLCLYKKILLRFVVVDGTSGNNKKSIFAKIYLICFTSIVKHRTFFLAACIYTCYTRDKTENGCAMEFLVCIFMRTRSDKTRKLNTTRKLNIKNIIFENIEQHFMFNNFYFYIRNN